MNQQQPKGMVEQAQETSGFFVGTVHAAPIALRLFSRVPGSIGAGVLFPGILWSYAFMGIATAVWFPSEATRYFMYFFTISGWLWLIHLFFYFASHRNGNGTYSHHTGVGHLNVLFPNSPDPDFLAIMSDMLVAIVIAAVFFHLNDSGSAGVVLLMIPISILSAALIDMRNKARSRRFSSAVQEQAYYQQMMQRFLNQEDQE